MKNKISVIVPTYNGREKLPGIIKSLQSQTISGFETVVVIDGSTDGSKELLSSFKIHNFNLKIIEQENEGRSLVRNRGAQEALGELLIFYDDDMRPEADSLEKHLNFHRNHSNTICGGNQLENIHEANSDFDRYRCFLREKWLSRYAEITQINSENIYLTAANFSVPKKLFHSLGGFDEKMNDHEDRDLALRAIKNGISVFFDPFNIAWHNDFISVYTYIQRRREYHREFIKQGNIFNQSSLNRFFYYVFAQTIWVKTIDKECLRFLPKKFRYRLYDVIIWGFAIYYPNKPLAV